MRSWLLRVCLVLPLAACFDGEALVEEDAGGGGASGAGGEGGAPSCTCNPGVCQTCDESAGCSLAPKAPGEPCTGGGGVCQGGNFVEQCGQRISQRAFPGAGTWSSTAVSQLFSGPNAPPPWGIVASEQTTDGTRLFVLRSDGTMYERRNGVWQVPSAASTLFSTTPVSQKVPQVCDEAPLPSTAITSMAKGRFYADEVFILSTDESPPRSYQYTVQESGSFAIQFTGCSDAIPPEDPEGMTNNEAPQHLAGIDWSFGMFVAPYPTTPDSQTIFKVMSGTVYEYWAGSSNFIYPFPPVSEAESALAIDGLDGAPAPGSVEAAHYDEAQSVLYVMGD
jgi:hypothetical protein